MHRSPRRALPTVVSVLSLALAGALVPITTAGAQPSATDLIISEYVEGSGNNKGVELYNGTLAPVDLAEYTLEVYSNGSATVSTTIALQGSVAAGETFVLAHPDLAASADQRVASGLWNGDDAIVLRRPTGVVDSLGRVGEDPGTAWTGGGVSTLNSTLRRSADTCAGDPDTADSFDPSVGWVSFAQDTIDGLGGHTSDCTGGGGGPVDPPVEDCAVPTTAIGLVQGPGEATPLAGQSVTVQGTVVGDFQDGGFNGYYLQDGGDANPETSDGVFVFAPSGAPVASGDVVRVTGTASEGFGMTQVTASRVQVCEQDLALPAPVDVTLPADGADLEPTEGMRVALPQSLAILEHFAYGRFGEIVLGTERQFQPTARHEPGSPEAVALRETHLASRITLDDGRGVQNPDPARHPDGTEFTLDNTFRGGDLVTGATGVLDFRFDRWRVQPTEGAQVTVANPRPEVPDVGGGITVASYNVLNYFTTLGSRGADDAQELERQQAKIVSALAQMNADVVGLIEIENNGTAVEALVRALNAEVGVGTYAAIDTGVIGTDEITTAFIYQPARVEPFGEFATLTSDVDARFLDSKNRPSLAQTFTQRTTGGVLTVAVNHLKSKGSGCEDVGDPEDPDGQGNCNGVRTDAARALADWLASDPTDSGVDSTLVIGDLNAYDEEDPIRALEEAGWTDLLAQEQGEQAYSYVFDGQLGYLDYALASPGLQPVVTGADTWAINADEPSLLDYDTSFKKDAQDALYAPDPFRSSDHDPVLVGLELSPNQRVVERVEGADRYETAAKMALRAGPSDTVFVANGTVFPDALAAAPAAIREEAGLLLTTRDRLPRASAQALTELDPEQVVVLGGSDRVGPGVRAEIAALTGAPVVGIAGRNRYDTAAQIAARFEPEQVDTVYLASGEEFADALAAGPLAGAGSDPVLLTQEERLSPETAAALDSLDPDSVVILGSEARIEDRVFQDVRAYAARVTRVGGNDRYETAALIARRLPGSDTAYLATGLDFADALGGSVLAGRTPAPLLLTRRDSLEEVTAETLLALDPGTVLLLGGEPTVSADVLAAVRALWG